MTDNVKLLPHIFFSRKEDVLYEHPPIIDIAYIKSLFLDFGSIRAFHYNRIIHIV